MGENLKDIGRHLPGKAVEATVNFFNYITNAHAKAHNGNKNGCCGVKLAADILDIISFELVHSNRPDCPICAKIMHENFKNTHAEKVAGILYDNNITAASLIEPHKL